MARWLVTVEYAASNFDFRTRSRVLAIRRLFIDMGFTVENRPSEYYNPHSQRMFYVIHPKESAMTMFRLKYNLANTITVEQL